MSIPAKCSHWGASYNLGDQMLGKKVRCKSCQKPFLVEDPAAAPARPQPAAVEDDLADDELPRGHKGASRSARKSSTGKMVLIVGGLAAALLLICSGTVVGGLWLTGFFGGQTQEQIPGGPVVVNGNPGNLTPEQLRALGPPAETAVAKYLAAPNKDVVLDVCKILGDIGTKKSIPTLKKVVVPTQVKQKDIAVAAALAIQQIGMR